MANYHGSLEAVDCHIHSMRYDMAVNRGACGGTYKDLLQWNISFYTIATNDNRLVEAVHCDIHCASYDMLLLLDC